MFKTVFLIKGSRSFWSNRKKEWRKAFRKSKSFDNSCRNHGGCGYCKQNRTFVNKRREPLVILEELYEY